jgi:hypothetical protein
MHIKFRAAFFLRKYQIAFQVMAVCYILYGKKQACRQPGYRHAESGTIPEFGTKVVGIDQQILCRAEDVILSQTLIETGTGEP